tara:strand:+ start:7612 stop:9399 length:1788 start_codon:yes stop_codon:yes gene_type:complete
MLFETILFIFLIFLALIFFLREIFPIDVTALLLLCVLIIFDYLTLEEAISGFSNKAVLTVALMFVLSASIVKTGIIEVLADKLTQLSNNVWFTVGLILIGTSLISGFINNTATVAIFIPFALHLGKKYELSPSKLLIPLSFAGIYGGMLTLIGTSTNLIVSSIVEDYGLEPLKMFDFLTMGLVFLLFGTFYNVFLVPKLLSSRAGISSLTGKYHLSAYLTEFEVDNESPLIGSTCLDRGVSKNYDITVLSIIRNDERIETNLRNQKIKSGDILMARGTLDNFIRFRDEEKLLMLTDKKMNQNELISGASTIVEGLVTQNSSLIGNSLFDVDFRKKFGAFVLAVRREGKTLREKIARIKLHFADTLLIFVPKSSMDSMIKNRDLAILQEHEVSIKKVKFWWLAIAVIPLAMLLAALGVVDILEAALIGVVILLVVGAISPEEAYQSINWSVIIMIAAFVPVGIAMERSGAAEIIASLVSNFGSNFDVQMAPHASMSLMFLISIIITSLMSNNTAAIILIPIAISVSTQMNVDAKPFIFAVAFGASTSFATPMGYQTNLMVYGPGQYKFSDFVKVGVPLNIIFWLLGTFFIPIIWSF